MEKGVCVTPFNYDPSIHAGQSFLADPLDPKDPRRSRTSQSDKADSDINNIVEKYLKTGVLPDEVLQKRQAIYGDATALPSSYLEARNLVERAHESFATLPAKVRERFGNDPSALFDFIADPANVEECLKLNLLPKDVVDRIKKAKADAIAAAAAEAAQAAQQPTESGGPTVPPA